VEAERYVSNHCRTNGIDRDDYMVREAGMKSLSLAILMVALGVMSGCFADPVSRQTTNNKQIDVEFIFEHDGCKAYRFEDGGSERYYVDCRNSTTVTWDERHGKVTVPVQVEVARP
jgi:Domain of unknown function (DUF4884)